LSAYIQSNHTMLILTADDDASHVKLNYFDTQTWKRVIVPFPYMVVAMDLDETNLAVIATVIVMKTQAVNIIRVPLATMKAELIISYTEYGGGTGCNYYDPSSGIYYVALGDGNGNFWIASVDTNKKTSKVVQVGYLAYSWVLMPSSIDLSGGHLSINHH